MDAARRALDEIKKLDDDIQNPALSKEEKDRKSKLRSEKAAELQNMDREIREFETSREKQLQEQSTRMRAGIVDDINQVVAGRVKAENYSMVFDKSGPSLNGVPVVLSALEGYDFTNDVISILNKSRGKEESAKPSTHSTAEVGPKPANSSEGTKK